jgi:hypothetical protein
MIFLNFHSINSSKWTKCLSGVFLCLLLNLHSYGQEGRKESKLKHRISAGAIVSLFKNDPHFSTGTKAKIGGNICYKTELLLGRKTNLLLGLEYLSQGLHFQGYYEKPGYTYLYDESFAYRHEIRYNEIQLPIGLKLSFNSDKESAATPYLFGGIGFRYIINSYVVISNDSTETTPFDGKGSIGFEHELLFPGFNAFYQGGLGVQKNYRTTSKAIFFEITFKRGFSRIHYPGNANSNNINFRDNNLAFTLGIRL